MADEKASEARAKPSKRRGINITELPSCVLTVLCNVTWVVLQDRPDLLLSRCVTQDG